MVNNSEVLPEKRPNPPLLGFWLLFLGFLLMLFVLLRLVLSTLGRSGRLNASSRSSRQRGICRNVYGRNRNGRRGGRGVSGKQAGGAYGKSKRRDDDKSFFHYWKSAARSSRRTVQHYRTRELQVGFIPKSGRLNFIFTKNEKSTLG